jgi:hypothetical protein
MSRQKNDVFGFYKIQAISMADKLQNSTSAIFLYPYAFLIYSSLNISPDLINTLYI